MKYLRSITEMFDPMGSWDPRQLDKLDKKDDNLKQGDKVIIDLGDKTIEGEFHRHGEGSSDIVLVDGAIRFVSRDKIRKA